MLGRIKNKNLNKRSLYKSVILNSPLKMANFNVAIIFYSFIVVTVLCKEAPIDDIVLLKFYQVLGCKEAQEFDYFRPKR